jgi:hypothetical protein
MQSRKRQQLNLCQNFSNLELNLYEKNEFPEWLKNSRLHKPSIYIYIYIYIYSRDKNITKTPFLRLIYFCSFTIILTLLLLTFLF